MNRLRELLACPHPWRGWRARVLQAMADASMAGVPDEAIHETMGGRDAFRRFVVDCKAIGMVMHRGRG